MKRFLTMLLALCCVLSLLAGCSGQAHGVPGNEVSPQPVETAGPVADPSPEGSAAQEPPVILVSPSTPSDGLPANTGDIPALQPDEETTLSYKPGSETITADAIRHYTLLGYSIVYIPELYTCQSFGEVDVYSVSDGNYLSVSRVMGIPAQNVLEDLRAQEGVDPGADLVTEDVAGSPAYVLSASGEGQTDRRFYVLDCGDDTLLVEMSCTTDDGEQAQRYLAIHNAMLASLELTD